jgi:hypothetical protein
LKENVQLAKFRIKEMRTRDGVEEGGNEVIMVMIWITMAEERSTRYLQK